QPGALTVPAGTTITWRNSDVAAHTVTADDSTFDSQRIAPDGSFSVTLDQPGTYTYHCEFHPNMEATIEVTG
ncbi:MAG: plastocyanin, partial [Actinobacteria bacterium QS_8_72_14]